MLSKTRIQQSFHKAASRYDADALLQRQVAQELFKGCRHLFPVQGKVLDAGCGTGYFHELTRSHGHKWALYQLDLAFGMCRYAAEYASPPSYGGTYTVNGEVEALPFADSSMEGIFSSLMLQWVGDIGAAFSECYRALSPGGVLCFSTLLPGTLRELAQVFSAIDSNPHINHFLPEAEVLQAVKQAGFSKVTSKTEQRTLFYPGAYALLRAIKNIGASSKSGQGGLNRCKLAQLEALYQQRYGGAEGVPASWQVCYVMAEK